MMRGQIWPSYADVVKRMGRKDHFKGPRQALG